jgi:cobalt/nickel transport system permease protein
MHIPDGYLSPATCAVGYLGMLPIWALAVKKVKRALNTRLIPLMVIGAAFSFVLMMFNVPIPGGTTAHAVGGGILAILLGPWAAAICVSIALSIQALMFGDGGVFAYGFNCFNMAVVLPFTTYFIYQLFARNAEAGSARRWIWGAIGSYVGINLAASCVGLELGVQPLLFHTAQGVPLYSPYSIGIAVPAMLFAHLLMAGPVECLVTGLVTRYFQATDPALVCRQIAAPGQKSFNKLWYVLIAMIVLCPLGLLAPGGAFGEGYAEDIKSAVGFVPAGLAALRDHYHGLLQDYGIPGYGGANPDLWHQSVGYYLAAVVGIALIVVLTLVISRLVARHDQRESLKP